MRRDPPGPERAVLGLVATHRAAELKTIAVKATLIDLVPLSRSLASVTAGGFSEWSRSPTAHCRMTHPEGETRPAAETDSRRWDFKVSPLFVANRVCSLTRMCVYSVIVSRAASTHFSHTHKHTRVSDLWRISATEKQDVTYSCLHKTLTSKEIYQILTYICFILKVQNGCSKC